MLNWSTEAIITLVSGIPIGYGVLLLFRKYREHSDTIFGILTINWLLQTIYLLNYGIAYLFLQPQILRYNVIFLLTNLFALILLYDFQIREQVDPLKISVASILAVFLIMSAFEPDAVIRADWSSGDISYALAGNYRLITTITAAIMGLIYIAYAIRIMVQVPPHLKFWARLNLLGVLLFTQVVVVFFALGWTQTIPGIATLLSAIGGALAIFAFIQSPQLIYVLPFTCRRLMVLDSEAGTSLYSYEWVDDNIKLNDDLISSAISGLTSFTNEVLHSKNINQIVMDNAIMYINSVPYHGIQVILISSSISRVLRENVDTFTSAFVKLLPKVNTQPNYADTTEFKKADELVEKSFPYIPRYIS